MQQWNAGLQRELARGILVDVSYIGSKGTHLGLFRRFNTPLAYRNGGRPRAHVPAICSPCEHFPDLGTIFQRQHIGNSSFQSLQIKAEKRMGRSLSFLASYVWSKSIDDATSVIVGLYDSAGAQNENDLRSERGLSFFDVRSRLSAGFTWNLPALQQAHWLTANWRLSSILTFQDGTPLDPLYFGFDFANTGTPNRPNVVPGQRISLPGSQRTPDHWFNTAAFSDPAPFTFGNAGRDVIPGPGNEVVNAALGRKFASPSSCHLVSGERSSICSTIRTSEFLAPTRISARSSGRFWRAAIPAECSSPRGLSSDHEHSSRTADRARCHSSARPGNKCFTAGSRLSRAIPGSVAQLRRRHME